MAVKTNQKAVSPQSNAVTYEQSVSGGGNRFSDDGEKALAASIAAIGMQRRKYAAGRTFCGECLPQFTTFPGYSWQITQAAPAHFNAVRLRFANTTQGPVVIDRIIVASVDRVANSFTPSGTSESGNPAQWVYGTFSGANSGTIPANTKPTHDTDPTYFYSDWIPCESVPRSDGGTLPLVMARAYLSTSSTIPGSGAGWGIGSGWQDETSAPYYQAWFKSGDYVGTNIGGFTSPDLPGASVIVSVEYATRVPSILLAGFGDSIMRGYVLSQDGYSWLQKAAHLESTTTSPIFVDNFGWDGQAVDKYYARWAEYIKGTKPNIAFFNAGSPNGSGVVSAKTVSDHLAYCHMFVADCVEAGVIPVLVTMCPKDDYTLAQDAFRKSLNSLIKQIQGVFIIDADSAVSDGASPARFKSGYALPDGVHPSDVGRDSIVQVAREVIASMIEVLR